MNYEYVIILYCFRENFDTAPQVIVCRPIGENSTFYHSLLIGSKRYRYYMRNVYVGIYRPIPCTLHVSIIIIIIICVVIVVIVIIAKFRNHLIEIQIAVMLAKNGYESEVEEKIHST